MVWIGFWIVLGAAVGWAAADAKGFSRSAGIIGGLLLGILSPLLFLVSATRRKCPHCSEWASEEARVCPHCQRDIPPSTPSEHYDYTEGKYVPGPPEPAPSPPLQRECPYCAEQILAKARVCKHCGRDVEPVLPEKTPSATKNAEFRGGVCVTRERSSAWRSWGFMVGVAIRALQNHRSRRVFHFGGVKI